MGYVFNNQVLGKAKITDEQNNDFTLNGVNAREESADSIMGGLSYILDIVGWSIQDATRIINQDIVEE